MRWWRAPGTARRGFRPVCGSSLFWDGPGENLSIHAGILDGGAPELTGHILCAEKGGYHRIADGLPQAPGRDPALTTVAPAQGGSTSRVRGEDRTEQRGAGHVAALRQEGAPAHATLSLWPGGTLVRPANARGDP